MKLIPANLKTKKDFILRLIDGEPFFDVNGNEIYFDEKYSHPFRLKGTGIPPIKFSMGCDLSKIKKEREWYHSDLSVKPILCWVDGSNGEKIAVLINEYKSDSNYPFNSEEACFDKACPVTVEDLL